MLGAVLLGGCDGGGPAPPPVVGAAPETVAPEKAALCRALQAELEKFTPRRFTGPVAVANQTREGFRKKLQASMEAEYPEAKARGYVSAFAALGLVPPGLDLRKEVADAFASQVSAYYEPSEDTFYPVSVGLPEAEERLMFIHELQHALQDQALALDDVMAALESTEDNTDRVQAARYLFEGEAHWVSLAWSIGEKGAGNPLTDSSVAARVFRGPARMRFQDFLAQMRANVDAMGPEGREQVRTLESVPPWITRGMLEAYLAGAWGVHRVFAHGGWEAVDALWTHPPTSTEQMLHPLEKLLGDRREEPVEVVLPELAATLGAGWTRVHADTLGEAGIHILLSEQLAEVNLGRARSGSAGWGGDRLAAWTHPAAPYPVVTWLTTWDSDQDATQFFEAYGLAAAARNTARGWPAAGLRRAGRAVAIVEGQGVATVTGALLAALLAAAPQRR